MGAHAAVPARGTKGRGRSAGQAAGQATTTMSRAAWAIPLLLGLTYGIYTTFMARGTTPDPLSWSNVGFGVLCGAIVTAVAFLVGKATKTRTPGIRATSFATPFGIAMGFLYSLGGGSILTSVFMGLILGAGMFVSAYYAFYSHSD